MRLCIEYTLVRAPLGVVDDRVVARFLPEDSAARQSFERALDRFDQAATKWLGDPDGSGPGGQQTAEDEPRSSAPFAAEPEQPATDARDDAAGPAAEASVAAPEEVEEEQIEELTDELLEQEETETFAGELADDDELRRVQAELNAKRLVEEQHEEQHDGQDGD